MRAVHVGFLLLLGVRCSPPAAGAAPAASACARLGARRPRPSSLGLYHWVSTRPLILRAGDPRRADIVVGVVVARAGLRGAARLMGLALPLICRPLPRLRPVRPAPAGAARPSRLRLRPGRRPDVLGTEGIYGMPTYVSSTYIFLFILFGAFLERAGMIQLFTDVALGIVGHQRGGPAKVAVISSALMGTINGSGVANVVTTGQFTIPLMKRFGYRAGLRRRGRGDRQHGRPDHAAGDGRRRLHHGRDHRRALRRDRQAAIIPAAALLRHGVLDGASRGRQARPGRPAARPVPERARARCAQTGTCCCRWPPSSGCCSPATRRCSPAPSAWR